MITNKTEIEKSQVLRNSINHDSSYVKTTA